MIEYVIILVLLLVLCFQQWFYLRQIGKMTDKIMAGNYNNYAQAQAYLQQAEKPEMHEKLELPEEDPELRRLNQMIAPPL